MTTPDDVYFVNALGLDRSSDFKVTYHASVNFGAEVNLHHVIRIRKEGTGRVLRFLAPFSDLEIQDGERLSRAKTLRVREAIRWFQDVGIL